MRAKRLTDMPIARSHVLETEKRDKTAHSGRERFCTYLARLTYQEIGGFPFAKADHRHA